MKTTMTQKGKKRAAKAAVRKATEKLVKEVRTARKAARRPATRTLAVTEPAPTRRMRANGSAGRAVVARAIKATAQPRYGDGITRFGDGSRYVVDPVPPPVPGKAKVKLDLQSRSDSNLVGFGHSHDLAITGNAYFTTPEPSTAVFEAKLGELEAVLSALENHKVAGKALTDQRDLIRADFELLFTQRGNYVQTTSQGDAVVIMSAGLQVKNAPTPAGLLPAPLSLRVDLNNEEGVMLIRWDSVAGAKSYMLEVAEVVDNVAVGWRLLYMGGKFSTRQTGMVVGKTYAFRVAAVGGEDGKSAWSPEVWRAAA